MTREEIKDIVSKQRAYFESGKTLPIKARCEALKKLREALHVNEDKLKDAIKKDLGKGAFEGYMCEVGLTISEISHMLKNVRRFAENKRVTTPLAQFASRSYVKSSPYGVTLIMSPWNYPVLLSLGPLVDSIAAGNTVVLKPSAYSPNVSRVLAELLGSLFDEGLVSVVTGGREENSHLLEEKFDYIFFTGSKAVGSYVLEKAAPHVTPVTLELGGKSPCIVEKSANLSLAAKRIVFGKYLNCGQTCVAPDYILCDEKVKDEFIKLVKAEILKQYGENPLKCDDYGKIINEKHFNRVLSLIDGSKTVHGGKSDRESLKIEPTVMDNVSLSDAVMQEEIFGPIMPVITYRDINEVYDIVKKNPTPLAFYIFTGNLKLADKIMSEISFGGGCINDVVIHLATCYMGFGGVGTSGMGAYHGKTGFDTFSHKKSIVDKKTWLDLPMRYRPYKNFNEKLLRMFLK